MRHYKPFKLIACAGLIAATSTGCTSLQTKETEGRTSLAKQEQSFWKKLPFVGDKEHADKSPYPNPVQVAATWSPDTLTQTGRTPTRGFGGRLFFFDEQTHAVPVDGKLVVHGFDETALNEKERVKKFEFTADQFTKHFSQSDLGASYSVWIPWDAIGGEQKEISLVASFVTAEGKTVQSSPAKVRLPGTKEDPATKLAQRYSPQYQEWKLAANSGRARRSGLTTTTISRPNSETGIELRPQSAQNGALVAGTNRTRSADVRVNRLPSRSLIMPASAKLPAKN